MAEPAAQSLNVVPTWLRKLWNAHPSVVVAGVVVVALAVSVALIWPITDLIAAHDVGLITGPKRAEDLRSESWPPWVPLGSDGGPGRRSVALSGQR